MIPISILFSISSISLFFFFSSTVLSAPTLKNEISEQITNVYSAFEFEIPINTFDSFEMFEVNASVVPVWIDPEIGDFVTEETSICNNGDMDKVKHNPFISGDFLFCVDENNGNIHIFNVSDKSNCIDTGNGYFTSSSDYQSVSVDGDIAYLAAGFSGFEILNISNHTDPVVLCSRDTQNGEYFLIVNEDLVYLANGGSGVLVYDVSDKSSPNLLKTVGGGTITDYLYRYEDTLYTSAWTSIKTINMTDPQDPIQVSSFDVPGTVKGIGRKGDFLFTANRLGSQLLVYNISNPLFPSLVKTYEFSDYTFYLIIKGNYLFLANDNNGIQILDITNATEAISVGNTPSSRTWGIISQGRYIYTSEIYDLRIFRVDPRRLTLKGTCTSRGKNSVVLRAYELDDENNFLEHKFNISCVCNGSVVCQHDGYLEDDCETCTCDSNQYWNGEYCEICNFTDCYNGVVNNECDGCICYGGWKGENCSVQDLSCNHGIFLCNATNCSCACYGGWIGSNCSECSHTCQNGGDYNDTCNGCICPVNYDDGEDCSQCVLPCENYGTVNSNCTLCFCSGGFTGSDCSTCPISCQNSGVFNSSFCSCDCDGGWEGQECSLCNLTSCSNGGSFNSTCTGCDCVKDWKGDDCSVCDPIVCENSGTPIPGDCYGCNCVGNWGGKYCSNCSDVLLPCVNGVQNDNCTFCICHEDWKGVDCSISQYYWTKEMDFSKKKTTFTPVIARNNSDLVFYGDTLFYSDKCVTKMIFTRLSSKGETKSMVGYDRTAYRFEDDGSLTTTGIYELNDGSFLIFGDDTFQDQNADRSIHVSKVNSLGDLLWSKMAGDDTPGVNEDVLGAFQLNNGVVVIACNDKFDNKNWGQAYFLIDPDTGEKIDIWTMEGSTNRKTTSFECNSVTGECFTGGKMSKKYSGVYHNMATITKFDSDFDYSWVRLFGVTNSFGQNNENEIMNLLAMSNGDIVAFIAYGDWTRTVAVVRIDTDGNLVWSYEMWRIFGDYILEVDNTQELNEGSILFRYEYNDNEAESYDVYVILSGDGTTIKNQFTLGFQSSLRQITHEYNSLDLEGTEFILVKYTDFKTYISRFEYGNTYQCPEIIFGNLGYTISSTSSFSGDWKYSIEYWSSDFGKNNVDLSWGDFNRGIDKFITQEQVIGEGYSEKSTCFTHKIFCDGITKISPNVCHSHGDCVSQNNCSCHHDYYPENDCSLFKCFDEEWNSSKVCNFQNGSCDAVNNCSCNYNTFGDECELWNCDNILFNNSETVCRGHGNCLSADTCQCDENYNYTTFCDWTCFGYAHDDPDVCSKVGTCVGYNNCTDCSEGYRGEMCEYWSCFGTYIDELGGEICESHGSCVKKDLCYCESGYSSSIAEGICDEWFCGEFFRNDSLNVCNQRGNCTSSHKCTCDTDYDGDLCDEFDCGLVSKTDPSGCNHHGQCISLQLCKCDDGYENQYCDMWKCSGIFKNLTDEVCGSHGTCVSSDLCQCESGYSNITCEEWYCGEFSRTNDTANICNQRGNCTSSHKCTCDTDYDGDLCNLFDCGLVSKTDPSGCNNHGTCISSQYCECNSGYENQYCDMWMCFGVYRNITDEVCGGHGTCSQKDLCLCKSGYSGRTCKEWFCQNTFKNNTEDSSFSVRIPGECSDHGTCISSHTCVCDLGYFDQFCSSWECYSKKMDDEKEVCSGKGVCEKKDTCICNTGYAGDECSTNTYYATILAPVAGTVGTYLIGSSVLIFIVIGIILVCCCCYCCICLCSSLCLLMFLSFRQRLRLKKFGKLENFDMLMEEQKVEQDENIGHIRINKDLFKIEISELKILKILGEGGSASVVYKARWKGQHVAFKCFKTRLICSKQDSFDEFEKEVEVMSSISHPNCIRFFGCSMNPPRVGIVMELCSKGEILEFIRDYRDLNEREFGDLKNRVKCGYPISGKMRMMKEICSAMDYIHSRGVIHRDLKCENVLIDKNETCKLMDYGVSKITGGGSDGAAMAKTMRVGTSFYMAPEITMGRLEYDEKVDVFSFSIMMWVILTENELPYGSADMGIEMRVANDPKYRPSLKDFEEKMKKEIQPSQKENKLKEFLVWAEDILKKCWDCDSKKRYGFNDLMEMFSEKEEFWKKIEDEFTDELQEDISIEKDSSSSSDDDDDESSDNDSSD